MKIILLILLVTISACSGVTPPDCKATPGAEIDNRGTTVQNKIIPKAVLKCNF